MQNKLLDRWIITWLWIGLIMVLIQFLLGSTTRLTGSGLSITKWEIVTGTLPPLNSEDWNLEFEKYKLTPQYKKINQGIPLSEFKFIYFWEYIHRLWARTIGLVFIFPFIYFLSKRALPIWLLKGLLITVGLGALEALAGWIMVASGLRDRPWVSAYNLTIHLVLGVLIIVSLFWLILKYQLNEVKEVLFQNRVINNVINILLVFVAAQLVLGGLMSGMKAALVYPSWPLMNGKLFPELILNSETWKLENWELYDTVQGPIAVVQFIHRNFAYLIGFILIYFYVLLIRNQFSLTKMNILPGLIYLIQCGLGIIVLLKSVGSIPVFFGVMHQLFAIIFILSCVYIKFYYNILNKSIKLKKP